jgi:predicted nucleotidyltransferase
MERAETIARLRENAETLRRMGATALFLFGSAARGEAASDSDIDLFIDYDATGRFSLLDLVGMKQFLEDAMDAEIDITTRDSLHPLIKSSIEQSAIRAF